MITGDKKIDVRPTEVRTDESADLAGASFGARQVDVTPEVDNGMQTHNPRAIANELFTMTVTATGEHPWLRAAEAEDGPYVESTLERSLRLGQTSLQGTVPTEVPTATKSELEIADRSAPSRPVLNIQSTAA